MGSYTRTSNAEKFLFRLCHLAIISVLLISCSSTIGQLNSNIPATATKLDTKFQVLAHLGSLPQPIKETEAVARYAISASGFPAEYLVVISPQQIKKDIEIVFKQTENHIDSIPAYHEYLDKLLRAHRSILKGELNEAKETLQQIKEQYNITYGYLVLASTLAVLEGDNKASGTYLKKALEIFPDSVALKDFSGLVKK